MPATFRARTHRKPFFRKRGKEMPKGMPHLPAFVAQAQIESKRNVLCPTFHFEWVQMKWIIIIFARITKKSSLINNAMRFRSLLFTILVVPALLVCCNKPTPEPKPEPQQEDPVTATITANDVTVEEGQSAPINASTNSSAAISYTSADPAVATVAAGTVTGVKAGNTTITLKVDAVEGKFTAAEKTINVTVTAVTPPDPPEDPYADAAPEVKNGDNVLATNPNVDKFLNEVHYPTHDYSKSELRTWAEANGISVCPGNSDRPSEYSIRWPAGATTEEVTVTVTEPTREWVYTPSTVETPYVNINNLLPNTHYTYKAVAGGKVLTEGAFDTYGKVHQLFFRTRIRNCRDLGGWKTEDGKMVKYRMVYRGGRLEPSYLSKVGKRAIKTEGIKAQLDLRGHSDVLSESTLKDIWGEGEYAFCAPVVEEGYSQMLKEDKEKTRQCMQFIFDCVDKNMPVYFHCSLGRDRTGTVAMLTLGILGVPEGDISQEYELTQFAPHGYATSDGEKSKMVRTVDYKGAANVIWGYAGEGSFQDGVNAYLLEIGISQADIDKFKANMLQ